MVEQQQIRILILHLAGRNQFTTCQDELSLQPTHCSKRSLLFGEIPQVAKEQKAATLSHSLGQEMHHTSAQCLETNCHSEHYKDRALKELLQMNLFNCLQEILNDRALCR